MTLGILINSDRNRDDIVGITEAAIKRGHSVILFFMDSGCLLLRDERILSLTKNEAVSMTVCDLNRKKFGLKDDEITEIRCGSQYDNAVMNRDSDKVIIL